MSEKDYSKYLIKQYKFWGVYIHEYQNYLGRCVIWCDREDANHFTDATPAELEELQQICKDLQVAMDSLFAPDWLNFAMLGNETPHLHCHFVPRYSEEIELYGYTFKDEEFGHNWKTNKDFIVSEEFLQSLKTLIKTIL